MRLDVLQNLLRPRPIDRAPHTRSKFLYIVPSFDPHIINLIGAFSLKWCMVIAITLQASKQVNRQEIKWWVRYNDVRWLIQSTGLWSNPSSFSCYKPPLFSSHFPCSSVRLGERPPSEHRWSSVTFIYIALILSYSTTTKIARDLLCANAHCSSVRYWPCRQKTYRVSFSLHRSRSAGWSEYCFRLLLLLLWSEIGPFYWPSWEIVKWS